LARQSSWRIEIKNIGVGAVLLGLAASFALAVPAAAASGGVDHWGVFLRPSNGQEFVPTAVAGLPADVVAIQAGNSSGMALDSLGHVWTWGDETGGALGNGRSSGYRAYARQVQGLPKIVAMGENYDTDVAIAANGAAWGWGINNFGSLCTTGEHTTPVRLMALSDVVAAEGGGGHMLYLTGNGTVKSCGLNANGELGVGTFMNSSSPVTVLLPGPASSISAGMETSTAILTNGQVWDWGWNAFGQVGNGTTSDANVPQHVVLPAAALQVGDGGNDFTDGQSIALLSNGQVWGWGNDQWGQLGDGLKRAVVSRPVRATKLSTLSIAKVVSGGSHSLVLDGAGNVYGFGNNTSGQVGSGSGERVVLDPTKVVTGATAISSTEDNSLALTG